MEKALQLCPGVVFDGQSQYKLHLNALPSLGHKARRVLADAGKPLHFREIARRINESAVKAGEKRPIERLQGLTSQLSQRDWFEPIGRSGSWCLAVWEEVRTDSVVELMKEALSARQEGTSSQEIHAYVEQFRPEVPQNTIVTLLHMREDLFIRVGRNRYELTSWGGKPASKEMRSSSAITELFKEIVQSMAEEQDASTFPLAELVSTLRDRGDLPDSTVRARISKSDWAKVFDADDGTKLVEVDIETLASIEPGRNYPSPITDKVEEAVREYLLKEPNARAQVVDIWKHVTAVTGVKRPTIYAVLDDMEGLKKSQEGKKLFASLEGFGEESRVELPGLELIPEGDVRDALESVRAKLNVKDIDIGLFQLGKIFENEVRQLLVAGKRVGKFEVSNRDLSSLSRMIDAVVRVGEIREAHHLTLLREQRNERAHGDIPSEKERRELLSHAPFLVKLYMTYILQLNERRRELAEPASGGDNP